MNISTVSPLSARSNPAAMTGTNATPVSGGLRSVQDGRGVEGLPEGSDARSAADAEVARSFSKTLMAGPYRQPIKPLTVQVPPESTLGRWRSLLDSAFKAPGFLGWAKEQSLDTTALIINPAQGEISGYVNGELRVFSLLDDSGWSDVSRALLSTAKVFAPEPGQKLQYPWSGQSNEVPASLVAQFYGEPVEPTPAQAATRLNQLKENPVLKWPDNYAPARSDEALLTLQEALGDDANQYAVMTALRSQVDDANGSIDLGNVKISIDPRSARYKSTQRSQMSIAELLKDDGNKVPVNSRQAHDLALALSFDLAHRAPGVESGGAMPLTDLSATALRKMKALVEKWKLQQPARTSDPLGGPGADTLLNHLIRTLPESTRKAMRDNPSLGWDLVIRSPEAQALGKEIQATIRLSENPINTIVSINAALVYELDPGASKSPFNLAGYNLYSAENAGASHAEILRRFTAHLEKSVGIEGAAIAARLLVSAAAPEFLVRDVPSHLVYGSHTWANFAIEASRIELQVPGALANMTFSQVMAFGNTPPISEEGEDQLGLAARGPVIAWGIANEVIKINSTHNYAAEEVEFAQSALNKQIKELQWASETLKKLPASREEMALAELKRVFPDVDPKREALHRRYQKDSPHSLLDVYMSGPIDPDDWISKDENYPYETMKSRISQLVPDIKATFEDKFAEYRRSHENAFAILFKYQLSLLPIAERHAMKESTVSFHELRRPYTKGHNFRDRSRVKFKPEPYTDEEAMKLKGRYGLLMRADQGGGKVDYYRYVPGQSTMTRISGLPENLPNIKVRPWDPIGNHPGIKLDIDDSVFFGEPPKQGLSESQVLVSNFGAANDERDQPGNTGTIPGAYFSPRNGSLGLTAGKFFTSEYDITQAASTGETRIEKERQYNEKVKQFFLGLIPFYDTIRSAIAGDVSGALIGLGFDALGFIIPGAAAGRKAYKAGRGAFNIIKSGVVAGIGESTGVTDVVNISRNVKNGVSAGYKDLKLLGERSKDILSRLKGNYEHYVKGKKYKENDIVKGFSRSEADTTWQPVVAIFKAGVWYPYNIATKAPYGIQVTEFAVFN